MIKHHCPGTKSFDLLNHRLPVLHGELNIGHTGQFKVTVRNSFLERSGDGLTVGNLLLNDVNSIVIGLPKSPILHVFQENREGVAVMHLGGISLETVTVFIRVICDVISVLTLRNTPQ